MSRPDPIADATPRVGDRALARSVTATWWYTVGGLVFFGFVAMAQWPLWVLLRYDSDTGIGWRLPLSCAGVVFAVGGVSLLLRGYRPGVIAEPDDERPRLPLRDAAGFGIMLTAAVLLGITTGSWVAGLSVVVFALSVRPWLHGIRWRVILALTVLLAVVWIAETAWSETPQPAVGTFLVPALFTVLLPLIAASSLWWWDIVLELDRARQAESLLAATRERLRLANDVHDLQGHHLQVIALQLELAQRLMDRDPQGAAREIERARAAVDDARQGTRDLAAAFRGVPLPDEFENAADLLRSAGLDVHAQLQPGADAAPADVLGPIVRESVTNVLKHGDGRWARLSLERVENHWVYRIANDDAGPDDVGFGSGLAGMTERAHAVGGDARVRREADTFELTVSLPARDETTGRESA